MKLKEILRVIQKKQLVQLKIHENYIDRTDITFNIDDIKVIDIDKKLYDFNVINIYTLYDQELDADKIVIEILETKNNKTTQSDNNSTYFYGIDFKKIRVYCKVKFESALKIKNLYRQRNEAILKINTDKYYFVEYVGLADKILRITVDGTKLKFLKDEKLDSLIVEKDSEERFYLTLSYDDVEFSYFFEDTLEDELEKNIF